MTAVPPFVTHYYRADRSPFLNLSYLAGPDQAAVLTELASPNSQAKSGRRFGPRYMALRRATELRARDLFISAGGEPQLTSPHYFVLGSSDWFAGLYRDLSEIRLPLAELPAESTSATYGDSITALGLGTELGVPAPDPNHADRIYRLNELAELLARFGLPSHRAPADLAGYIGHQHHRVDTYIEIQLWSDDPIVDYLTRG